MKNLITKNLNGKTIILLFVLTNAIYLVMLLLTIPHVMTYSGGLKLLDMMPAGYDADYVNRLLDTLSAEGRNAYLYHQIPLDMLYPALFGITYCLILGSFIQRIGKQDSPLFYICYLPLFSGLFDYAENAGIISMLNIYPGNTDMLARVTTVFSVLKSAFTTVSFVLLIVILIAFGVQKIFKRKNLHT